MKPNINNPDDQTPKSTLILLITFFCALTLGLLYRIYEELISLKHISKSPIVFELDSTLIPMLILAPSVFMLIHIFIKRLKQTARTKDVHRTIKTIIINFPIFLLTAVLFSWQQAKWMKKQGYQECPWYQGSTFGAPKVWVKDSEYCLKIGYKVRHEIIDWATTNEDSNISSEEFQNKVHSLLN